MGVIWTILILGILILAHELGHFAVAKWSGITVYDFSIGMGPSLFSWGGKDGQTSYNLRLLPIGGYVRMAGEDEESDDPNSFDKKPVLKRIAVIFAGPFMNFLIAIVFFCIAYMAIGIPTEQPIAGDLIKDEPAYSAGLEKGDKVISIEGKKIASWNDMTTIIRANPNKKLDFVVEHNGQTKNLAITPQLTKIESEDGKQSESYATIGMYPAVEKANIGKSIKLGLQQSYETTKLLIVTLFKMITGQIAPDVAGPVGITNIVSDVASQNVLNLLLLAGILSINLAVINLLPLPALDGSRIIFLTIEGIRGKPVRKEVEGMIHFVGLVLLMLLMIFVTYNDIVNWVKGG